VVKQRFVLRLQLRRAREEEGDEEKASIVIYPSKEWRSRLCLRSKR
jgi:hypothetical protein